jgi:hypothetical protein
MEATTGKEVPLLLILDLGVVSQKLTYVSDVFTASLTRAIIDAVSTSEMSVNFNQDEFSA